MVIFFRIYLNQSWYKCRVVTLKLVPERHHKSLYFLSSVIIQPISGIVKIFEGH